MTTQDPTFAPGWPSAADTRELTSDEMAWLERIVEERQAERRQCARDAWRHYAPTVDPDHPALDGYLIATRDAIDKAAPGWRHGDPATLRYQEIARVREEWAAEAEKLREQMEKSCLKSK